jgi:neutral ceramidase
VAEAVAEQTGLKPGDIAITASHSHSAPANIFENDFYNKHMSSGEWLETTHLAFLTGQIAHGILKAHKDRRPAKVAAGCKDIHGYNRNRALTSYVLNEDVGTISLDDPEAVFKAVNPALCMVRADVQDDRGRYLPLAAYSIFSVHATAVTPPVEVYNADLFAYAQKDLEWTIRRTYDTPWPVVHGLTSGTEGDMAPALRDQGDSTFGHLPVDWKEAKRVGKGIGREAIRFFEELGGRLTDDLVVGAAVREINIRERNAVEDVVLCTSAVVGNPLAAGAYERRTPWLAAVPFLRGGSELSRRWWFTDGCQGNKRHLLFSFPQSLLEPKDSFPNTVLFQLIRVNDMVILPMPFEVTVISGRRIAARVQEEFGGAAENRIRHVAVASNSNGYFGYTTTPEEYFRQNYEGGHTLYGRYSTPYLAAQLGVLTRDFLARGEVQELASAWTYRVKVGAFYPEPGPSTGRRDAVAQPMPVRAEKAGEEDFIVFRWQDVGPSRVNLHEPLSRVEVERQQRWETLWVNGEPIHDDGYDLEVRYLAARENGMGEYEVRWYNPVPGGVYRFAVEPRQGHATLVSQPFSFTGFGAATP